MMATELGFKKPLSKEERIMKKKQRLAAIGNSPSLDFVPVIGSMLVNEISNVETI